MSLLLYSHWVFSNCTHNVALFLILTICPVSSNTGLTSHFLELLEVQNQHVSEVQEEPLGMSKASTKMIGSVDVTETPVVQRRK